MRLWIAFTTALSLATLPAAADWQDDVNSFDQGRLARLEQSRNDGMRQAERGAPEKDLAVIHALLDDEGGPISARELLGVWQCRQMKLGGLAPDILYSWFRCRVRQTKDGIYFEKLTGTERISGYVEDYENGRLVLLGALTVKKERAKPYSGANAGVGAISTSSDAVGVISSLGKGRARIEFPYPNIESDFDAIELKR